MRYSPQAKAVRLHLGAEDIDGREVLPEYLAAGDAEPAIQDGGVNLAKIGVMAKVVLVEVGKARMIADDSRPHGD